MTEPIIKCSGCHATKLASFYSIRKNTGQRFKCCDDCRGRVRTRPDSEKKLLCGHCEFRAFFPSHLEEHIKCVHDKIRDLQCPQCEQVFSYRSHLAKHIKSVHLQILDHHCPHCEYKCDCRDSLTKHVKAVHDKIRDLQCPQCEQTFSLSSSLATHVKAVHLQIRDQRCQQCEFTCSISSGMWRHIQRVHENVRNHRCSQCDFTSVTHYELTRHQKTCTGTLRMSSGEFAVKGVLESMCVLFEHQMRFADCKDIYTLPFDFYLPSYKMAIEYDGEQHFKPIEHWGGIPKFEATQRRDAIKTAYCATNGIRLLRIKYTDFELIPTLIENFLSSAEEFAVDDTHDTANATSNEPHDIESTQFQTPDPLQ